MSQESIDDLRLILDKLRRDTKAGFTILACAAVVVMAVALGFLIKGNLGIGASILTGGMFGTIVWAIAHISWLSK